HQGFARTPTWIFSGALMDVSADHGIACSDLVQRVAIHADAFDEFPEIDLPQMAVRVDEVVLPQIWIVLLLGADEFLKTRAAGSKGANVTANKLALQPQPIAQPCRRIHKAKEKQVIKIA